MVRRFLLLQQRPGNPPVGASRGKRPRRGRALWAALGARVPQPAVRDPRGRARALRRPQRLRARHPLPPPPGHPRGGGARRLAAGLADRALARDAHRAAAVRRRDHPPRCALLALPLRAPCAALGAARGERLCGIAYGRCLLGSEAWHDPAGARARHAGRGRVRLGATPARRPQTASFGGIRGQAAAQLTAGHG